jgi:hypothetical protein
MLLFAIAFLAQDWMPFSKTIGISRKKNGQRSRRLPVSFY